MNLSPDIFSRLDELVFHQNLSSQRIEDAFSFLTSLFRQLSTGFGVGTVFCLCAMAVLIILYRPRLGRGSFWMPAFGLFGGKPTLYLHTRPASFCGFFHHSRRLRSHRNAAWQRVPASGRSSLR